MTVRAATSVLLALLVAAALGACGSQEISLAGSDQANATIRDGAQIFADKCSGCHTLDAAGAQGSAYSVRDRERVDGPNFNVRKEQVAAVLYAIRNGGFSGAIMPENIITGQDAEKVAQFLAKYSGKNATVPATPNSGTAVNGG